MNFKEKADELTKKILESKINEKMDPVGKEDDDVDNDGDKDSSDEYLKNRRKAIAKAMKKEETELQEEAQKHVVAVTVSDPNSTMVSKRNEQIFKKLSVTASTKDTAVEMARKHYKKLGYRVHQAEYVGLKK